MDNNFNRSDLNVFLSEKEKREIEYLNNKSNKLQKISEKQNDPMHMTLTQLINLWATTNIHILIDLTNFFSGLSKYKIYFDDFTHRSPFTQPSLLDAYRIYGFEEVSVYKFRQLPMVWKYPALNYLCAIIAPFVPIRTKNKFLRWSRELMLVGVGIKPEKS